MTYTKGRSCEGKKRYPSKGAAQDYCRYAWGRWKVRVQPYPCKFCGGWHVGHPPRKKARRR